MPTPAFSCGLEAALSVLGGKWKLLILFHLGRGTRRFGELRRLVVGVSEKVLIQHLRELVSDGVVARTDFGEIPPRVEYALTPIGRSLTAALGPLCAWGEAHGEQLAALKDQRETAHAPAQT